MGLGIALQRIEPGKPQQNGCHERFHKTLKAEATRPAQSTLLAQQQRFDEWRHEYNEVRPHESLGQKTPASVYTPSDKAMPRVPEPLSYPLCEHTVRVHRGGSIRFGQRRFYIANVLSRRTLGLLQVEEPTYLVYFAQFELGYLDLVQQSFFPAFNPNLQTAEQVSTMSSI